MKRKKFERRFLWIVFIANLFMLIPIVLKKASIKDWLLVYFFNAATNIIADSILVKKRIIKYPIRLFPKVFKFHILFDFFIYPTFTILYNQITLKDRPFAIFYKLLYFTLPLSLVEDWAERNTKLIKWNKGWKWYHTFASVTIKSLFTRLFIGTVRKITYLFHH